VINSESIFMQTCGGKVKTRLEREKTGEKHSFGFELGKLKRVPYSSKGRVETGIKITMFTGVRPPRTSTKLGKKGKFRASHLIRGLSRKGEGGRGPSIKAFNRVRGERSR